MDVETIAARSELFVSGRLPSGTLREALVSHGRSSTRVNHPPAIGKSLTSPESQRPP
jgi:hypothetical protein